MTDGWTVQKLHASLRGHKKLGILNTELTLAFPVITGPCPANLFLRSAIVEASIFWNKGDG